MLHKALYSAHNDHNYFAVAHTIKYVGDMIGKSLNLYSFVDNHDVERIYTKLTNKAHFVPVHVMLYTLPGIPSIYYGSEFGMEGRKEGHSDDSLRPALDYDNYKDAVRTNPFTKLIATLGKIRQNTPALCYGQYKQLELQTTYFAYARTLDGKSVITTVNNGDQEVSMNLEAGFSAEYVGALTGRKVTVNDGKIQVTIAGNSGEIWIPTELTDRRMPTVEPIEIKKISVPIKEEVQEKIPASIEEEVTKTEPVKSAETLQKQQANVTEDRKKSYEEMTVEELQESILDKMRKNGPVTDYMLRTVRENTHHGSLVTWVRSFK